MRVWFGRRRRPSTALIEAQRRLERVSADDERVTRIQQATERHIRENRLGPIIRAALHTKRDTR